MADAKHAHIYLPQTVANDKPQVPHAPAQELVSVCDLHVHGGEHAHVDDEARHDFTREIATTLNNACTVKKFDRLVLAAPAKMIGELRTLLTPDAQRHIAGVLPKDLTHYHGRQLLDHLQDTLGEAQLL